MDCQTARLLIGFSPTSREMAAAEGEALETHLADCGPCGTFAQAERRFHGRMTDAMLRVPIPEGLELRILARLTAERGDAYRRWMGRSLRVALATAALFLISWQVWTIWQKPPPDLDLDRIHQDMFANLNAPDRERVEQWFAQNHHVAIHAPSQFDYAFLTHFDMAEFEGKRVPMLLFVNGDVSARVYVVSDKDFNFSTLPVTGTRISSSGITVDLWRNPGSDFAYVIVYKGENLAPVLEKPEANAA